MIFGDVENDMDTILTYAPGSEERDALARAIADQRGRVEEIPLIIDGKPVETGSIYEVRCPHDHERVLARAHLAGEKEIDRAIAGALRAREAWSALDGYHRAGIFRRAADLLAGPRRIEHIAAIMANQSKNPFEAEIDLAELVDFWRFNASFMEYLYGQQPRQSPGEINRFDWRPLEGFVLAVPPFNFYSIAGNLPTAPALLGNVALWKPSRSTLLANYRIMEVLLEAGLPDGVIQFVPYESRHGAGVLRHPELAGLHFTGSYETLVSLWQQIGNGLQEYKSFPRIVGETGGKDFIFVHASADVEQVVANALRGAYDYQGQKCSAASRMYVPESLWEPIKTGLVEQISRIKIGNVEDLDVFMGGIITEDAYAKIVSYLDHAKERHDEYEIVIGGEAWDAKGWFISPTLIRTRNPGAKLLTEEIFGPVLTVYVYPDEKFEETLESCDEASPYGLTGSIFARDRHAVARAERALRFSAGNFYINDKPTGAIVSRQPFGGARRSGTNDKAGFWLNLVRWASPRSIKEKLVPMRRWELTFMP